MKKFRFLCFGMILLCISSIFINLNIGFLDLKWIDLFRLNPENREIFQLRINRVLVMILAGLSIPTSGFLLQEFFKNPLASPSVLGISSVANLAVAFYIFLSQDIIFPDFLQNGLMSFSAILGSFLALFVLLFLTKKIHNSSYLIIFGFLISALAGALIGMLQFYAENQTLRMYTLWALGGNNQVDLSQIIILFFIVFIGLIISFLTLKPLIGLSLGNSYAKSLGVNLTRLKFLVIISSSLLSASVTAFLGPILFVGVVVPHFCRMIWNPSQLWHQWILNLILGVLCMEILSILSELSQIPINIISSILGIPVLILILIRASKRNYNFH